VVNVTQTSASATSVTETELVNSSNSSPVAVVSDSGWMDQNPRVVFGV
jgi:hypothetical protein